MALYPYLTILNNDHFTQVHLTLFYKMRKQAKWLSNIHRYLRQVCVRNKVQSSMCLKAWIFSILLKNERLETEWVVKRSKWLTNQERKATCSSLIFLAHGIKIWEKSRCLIGGCWGQVRKGKWGGEREGLKGLASLATTLRVSDQCPSSNKL